VNATPERIPFARLNQELLGVKQLRATPAPWIQQRVDLVAHTSSSESSSGGVGGILGVCLGLMPGVLLAKRRRLAEGRLRLLDLMNDIPRE